MTLKADLIQVTKNWSKIVSSKLSLNCDGTSPCPIAFPEDEINDCLRLYSAQVEADEQFEAYRDAIGVGAEGWVPADQYDEAKQREGKLRVDALDATESDEERVKLAEHWLLLISMKKSIHNKNDRWIGDYQSVMRSMRRKLL